MVLERKKVCTVAAIPVPVPFAVAERNQQIWSLESLYASGREEPKQGRDRYHTLSILCWQHIFHEPETKDLRTLLD